MGLRACIGAFAAAAVLASGAHAATVGDAAAGTDTGRQGILLGSSAPIKREMDAKTARRVFSVLSSDIVMGPRRGVVSPEELQILLGRDDAEVTADRNAPNDADNKLELAGAQVEVRAPRGVPEAAVQAPIPIGLASLVWGARHPASAWRLFLPVLN